MNNEPLSDDEIYSLIPDVYDYFSIFDFLKFARLIEARLIEKARTIEDKKCTETQTSSDSPKANPASFKLSKIASETLKQP